MPEWRHERARCMLCETRRNHVPSASASMSAKRNVALVRRCRRAAPWRPGAAGEGVMADATGEPNPRNSTLARRQSRGGR